MGVKITLENVDEYITSFIDHQYLTPEEEREVKALIDTDESVCKKYRSELLTKNMMRSRLGLQEEVPHQTYARVTGSIDDLVSSVLTEKKKTLQPVFADENLHYNLPFFAYLKKVLASRVRISRITVPAYSFAFAFMLLMLAAGLYVNFSRSTEVNPFVASGSDKNVMVQAVNNFHRILAGETSLLMNSSDENEVGKYLKNGTKFDAYVPCLKNCNLKGAMFNEYNGQKLAHIVYTSGKHVIYIYETHIASIHCKGLEIPDPVHNQIVSEKFYMCDHADADGCTLMLWYKDSVLCATVSNMPKHKLYNTIASLN